jgi:hypothetical protein
VILSPGPYLTVHDGRVRMDVSGARGGSIWLPAVNAVGGKLQLLARGRETDGGDIVIDGASTADVMHREISLGRCRSTSPVVAGGPRIRVDGRLRGGSFSASSSEDAIVCSPIKASGREAGGAVDVESTSADGFARARVAAADARPARARRHRARCRRGREPRLAREDPRRRRTRRRLRGRHTLRTAAKR